MKQILFQKIKIQNFLSVGSIPVEVEFNKGLHIITGINKDKEDRRNGVGKSTIADAIYFAVFGETLRDLKKEHIINNINKKNCCIELEVVIKYPDKLVENIKIVRTLEPSKCFVYINGEDKTRDSMANTTSFLLKKFSCTQEIFQNCVIMTVNNTIPFMAKKKQEKRKFIEDIFNLSIFSDMLNLLKADINERKKAFDIETTKYDEGIKVLNRYENQRQEALQEREKKINRYSQRQKDNIAELSEIDKKIAQFNTTDINAIKSDITTLTDNNKNIEKEIQSVRDVKAEKTLIVKQIHEQHTAIGTNAEKCPVCLRDIDKHDKEYIQNEKKSLKDKALKLLEDIKRYNETEKKLLVSHQELKDKLQAAQNKLHKHDLETQQKNNLLERQAQLNEYQKDLEQDIKDLEQTTQSVDNALEEQKEKIAEFKHKIEILKNELNTLDVVKFVVSEEGVKSYVVKKILKLFNSRLRYYLKKMDANCIVTFNEYFEEEIIDTKGKPCSYFNFSGAERKNIDLSCLFTFMDMRRLQGDVSFNFSIYDELFDSSLDEKGVELVIGILKERVEKYKESVMVISHRKESIKAATGDIIFLEKNNGITRRVDFTENLL